MNVKHKRVFNYPLIYQKPLSNLHLSSFTFSFHPMELSLKTLNALNEINRRQESSAERAAKSSGHVTAPLSDPIRPQVVKTKPERHREIY